MSPNVPSTKSKVDTILLWVCNSLVVLMLTFLWNLKGDIAVLQDHDSNWKTVLEKVSSMEINLNSVRLNGEDLKERMTRLEALQSSSKK